jgi:uncharacterized protein YjbJ (UPF0337 family)
MDEKEVKGKLDKLKGRAKEVMGEITGDRSKKAEGAYDRGKGAVKEKTGEAQRKLDEESEDNE